MATDDDATAAAEGAAADTSATALACFPLHIDVLWADGVDPREVSAVADPPASGGCPAGSYVRGERITLSLTEEFSDIHPVWGPSNDNVDLSCSLCSTTQLTMPAEELFSSPMFFSGPPLDADPSPTLAPSAEPATETALPETETPTATSTSPPATPTPVPATAIPPTPVPPAATATPTTVVLSGACYALTLILNYADEVTDDGLIPLVDPGVAANIPNSPGCPSGQYKEGQVLFVAVSQSFDLIQPVWGAAPNVPLSCAFCEVASFTMPGEGLFLGPLYFLK